ncbi:MAG: hypothetical protein ACP5GL_08050 [Infirmifilum sp.]
MFTASYSFVNVQGSQYLKVTLRNMGGSTISTAQSVFDIAIMGNGYSYMFSHPLLSLVNSPTLPVNGSIVYVSSMDNAPVSQASALTIVVSIVDRSSGKVTWYDQFTSSPYSSVQLVSFTPIRVIAGAPVGLGAVVSGGDPPYRYSWTASPSTGYFTSPNSATTDFYPLVPGTYSITVTVYDSLSFVNSAYVIYPVSPGGPASVARTLTLTATGSAPQPGGFSANPFILVNASFSGTVPAPQLGRITLTGNIYFYENGLPSGYQWSVTLSGKTKSAFAPNPIVFSNLNYGFYTYTVSNVGTYTPSPSSGVVHLNSPTDKEYITFTSRTPTNYPLVFTETGLPTGITWTVVVNNNPYSNSAPNSISINLPPNIYSYTVNPVNTNTNTYIPSPQSGTVDLRNGGQTVNIVFTAQSKSVNLIFQESGLPYGTYWSVMVNGQSFSSSSSIITVPVSMNTYVGYSVPNAYSGGVTYTPSPSSGQVYITQNNQVVYITFTPQYTLVFTETGLPSGTAWWVSLNGQQSSAVAPGKITFIEPAYNTYYYTVKSGFWVGGVYYVAVPSSGSVYLYQNNQVVTISYTPYYYINVTTCKLPAGSQWTAGVLQTGLTVTSTGNVISLWVNSPGSYTITVSVGTYTYSVFLPVSAENSHGGVYILSYNPNATASYSMNVQVSVSSSGDFTSCFRGYYQVILSGASSILPLYNSTNYYVNYSGNFFYANNSLVSNNIFFQGLISNFKGWQVAPLLPWSKGVLESNATTPTRLISLSGALRITSISSSTSGFSVAVPVEYGFSQSYPRLYAGATGFSQYAWAISGGPTLYTGSPYFSFTPNSVLMVSSMKINVSGLQGGQKVYLGTFYLTVYPALSLSVSFTNLTPVLPSYQFVASFNQPLPQGSSVSIDLSGFSAGTVQLAQVPGSLGYTWACTAYVPYAPSQSGYINTYLTVVTPSKTYRFPVTIYYTLLS